MTNRGISRAEADVDADLDAPNAGRAEREGAKTSSSAGRETRDRVGIVDGGPMKVEGVAEVGKEETER